MTERGPLYGLIGFPVLHSFSPAMHNAALRHLEMEGEYLLFEVAPQELEAFFDSETVRDASGREIASAWIRGLNVTVPHKERVLEYVQLDKESFYLKHLGAVNTVAFRPEGRAGFNTDVPGFSWHLHQLDVSPAGKRTAVAGAGGAARAVCYALVQKQVRSLAIFDIKRGRAEEVTAMLRRACPEFRGELTVADSVQGLNLKEKDLVVNATPVGMKPGDPSPLPEDELHEELFVYDLIYNPAETPLLAAARRRGARGSNGLGMLLSQGALAFRHFTGERAPLEVMRQALLKEMEKKHG
ncbi:MAG: shikimate dehydrogenase [Candidatus Omnitrophica bacterium]|nr:shikimate dehydrogenase [Candidatus Omnitrophota bacterium]